MARPVRWTDLHPYMEEVIALNVARDHLADTVEIVNARLARLEAAQAERERLAREAAQAASRRRRKARR